MPRDLSHDPACEAPPPINGPRYDDLTLSLVDWERREIEPRIYLLGSVFTTTTRAMLSADTGLGKTHLGFAIAFAMAAGEIFCHWQGHEPARVLIVDGEMSLDLVKERLAAATRRAGISPPTLFVVSKDEAEAMPPLDTIEGQKWLDGLIEHIGGIDFVILDNVMSLTTGDMKDEEAWKPVTTWMRSLTRRHIGCLWINHTGHIASRAYGTKTREWQLDTVAICEKVDGYPDADLAMRLTFSKARQRKPDNKADYEPVHLILRDDVWEAVGAQAANKKRQPRETGVALQSLTEAIQAVGQEIPQVGTVPANTMGVSLDTWRRYFYQRTPLDIESQEDTKERDKATDARRKRFTRCREALQESGHIFISGNWIWTV